MSAKNGESAVVKKQDQEKKMTCGIIMPIAGGTEYGTEHWKEVLSIISDAIKATEIFEPGLVSDDVAIGLIHERIVTNIYNNEIVVCDVSSKNPNVMFELGMRLAFDKPTIIVKDSETGYSFDTGVVEHLEYPKTLRFGDILNFQSKLTEKITATYKKSQNEPHFSPFLGTFGKTIKPAKINETEISQADYLVAQLDQLSSDFRDFRMAANRNISKYGKIGVDKTDILTHPEVEKSVRLSMANVIKSDGYINPMQFFNAVKNDMAKLGSYLPDDVVRTLIDNNMPFVRLITSPK